jgi:excisionase family DNA binding protein
MERDTSVIKPDEELMTVNEVARLLKVPASWVYERCREGTPNPLPHLKLGKYLRFSRSTLLAYIEGLRRGDPAGNIRKS